ncbi:choice-of-anchor L domain-containing protein [Nocardioides terrigena]|uniref:choice-of-anchor L domain-containing protein n=1 Tax=Nocardioides terrigena TaxID=424797 RepID=UPI00131F3F7D|nr:choice-of-anchor L domain-containing protein [Nocardioides terrigena]
MLMWSRRAASAVIVSVLAGAVAMVGPVVVADAAPSDGGVVHAAAKPTKRPGLLVKVRQPKKVGLARVIVTGPGRYRTTLASSRRLRNLRPGVYRISAKPVTSKKWRSTATVSQRRIRVTKRTAKVVVDYDTIISRSMSILPSKAVSKFTAPDDGVGTLTTSAKLSRGDIVASGVSAAAPAGILARVVGQSGSKGETVYKIEQTTLSEAIPRGDFKVSFSTDLTAPARKGANGRGARPLARRVPASCTASGSAGIEVTASGGISTDLWADWDWADSSINMRATASASASARAWLAGAGGCTLAETLLYQRGFAPITVSVGPIPIVILPKLEMFTGGAFGAEGSVEMRGDVGVQTVLNASGSKNGLKTSVTGPTATKSASFTTTAKASANIYARAVVTGELYGIAGPHASLKLAILANADKAANPWWSVDAVASGGVGVKVDKCVTVFSKDACNKFDRSKDDLFSKTFRIVDAGGPLSPPPTAPPGPPTDLNGGGVVITPPDTGGQAGAGHIPSPTGSGDAWVLSTGLISEVNGTDVGIEASTSREDPGDATLSALAGHPTEDASFMRMNVTPAGNRLRIDYLFATEEFPEYIGSKFNDVMGVFVNGQNCAHVPGTSTAVSVNTINDVTNSQYFIDNRDSHLPTVMNGLTTPLSCIVAVTPGVPVEVLVGVADASDSVFDSAVALVDGGISSYNG